MSKSKGTRSSWLRRPITAEMRRDILELRGQGLNLARIASRVEIGARRVASTLRDAGVQIKSLRPTKATRAARAKTIAAIDADIRARVDFLYKIAAKHGVGVRLVRKRRLVVLGPAKLESHWPPLRSKGSQLDAVEFVPTAQEHFLAIVRKCIDAAGDKLLRQSRNRADVIAAKRFLKHNPQPVLDKFETGLRHAVATLFRFEQMAVEDTVH